jgi:hypothetical protein
MTHITGEIFSQSGHLVYGEYSCHSFFAMYVAQLFSIWLIIKIIYLQFRSTWVKFMLFLFSIIKSWTKTTHVMGEVFFPNLVTLFVDDIAVHTLHFKEYLSHIVKFLM